MHLVPDHEAIPGGTAERVADHVVALRRAARAARDESDPKAVHDTRVAIRRLEAGLDTFRDVLPATRRRKARRALQSLRRRLSLARELEVTVQLLREHLADEAQDTAVAATAVLLRLQNRSRRQRRDAVRACAGRTVARIERRLRRAWRPVSGTAAAALAAARDRVDRRAAAALAALSAGLTSGGEEELHGARIAVKRWRYGEEWLAATRMERRVDPAWLRAIQTSLGTLHDLDVLRRRLDAYERKLVTANPGTGTPLSPMLERMLADRRSELARLHERVTPRLAATRSAPAGTSATRQ